MEAAQLNSPCQFDAEVASDTTDLRMDARCRAHAPLADLGMCFMILKSPGAQVHGVGVPDAMRGS